VPFFNKGKFPALGSLATKKPSAAELAQQLKNQMEIELSHLIGLKDTPSLHVMIEHIKYKYKVMAYEQALGDEFFGNKNPCGEVTLAPASSMPITAPQMQALKELAEKYPVQLKPHLSLSPVEANTGFTKGNMGLTISKTVTKNKPPKKKKTKPTEKPKEIFQWQMQSQKEVAGVKATYTTVLRADGSVACNCPGWIFKKKGQSERRCKHTDLVVEEGNILFKKYKNGQSLGAVLIDNTPKSSAPSYSPATAPTKYGRVIELD